MVRAESKTLVVPDDYNSIQEAINQAVEGDIVFIKKGTYIENPIINKSISIVGEDRDATIIDVTAGLLIEKNDVSITGLTIYDGSRGISIAANHCVISGNKITNSHTGIVLFQAKGNQITENIIQSISPSAAIQLSYSNSNTIKSNYVDLCTEGIQLREGSSSNTVTGNTIKNCKDVAIRLLGSNIGKTWYSSNDNIITKNNLLDSGYGTTIYRSNNNFITENNYVNNTVQLSADESYYLIGGGTPSVNSIYKNFWSDYKSSDTNGDGTGDIPYIIDANNQDNQPIMSKLNIPMEPPAPVPELTPITTLPLLMVILSAAIVLKLRRAKSKIPE